MKYAYYDETNGKLLGWYDSEIHSIIPEPNIEVSDEVWRESIDNNYNYIDTTTNTLSYKDFRTPEELKEQARMQAKSDRDKALNSITHTLADGSVYQVRPKDIPNYQLAIQMGNDTDWILADNTVRHTTIAELQEIMNSGIQQGKEIWDNYLNAIKTL